MLDKHDIEEIIERIPYNYFEGKSILITGATGFLASNIIHVIMYLNQFYFKEKCTIVALCRNIEKAKTVFNNYLYTQNFEICIQGVEQEILLSRNIDYIMHTASRAVTSEFKKKPAEILSANIVGTYNLLEFAKNKKVKGFLFFSSGAVYGKIPSDVKVIKEEELFTLQSLETENCYAEGKRAGESLCRAYWEQYGVPTKIVRISHTYGPGIDIEDGRIFSDFVKNIYNNENLVIKGTGNDVRPFCYITDAIVAFFIILLRGENGEVYNMANSKETYSIAELSKILVLKAFAERNLQVVGSNINLMKEIKKVFVDCSKLEELGWNPKVDVVEGFRRTVKSFEEDIK